MAILFTTERRGETQRGGAATKEHSPQSHGDTEKVKIKGKTREHGGGGDHGAAGWRHGGVGIGIRRCAHRQSTGPNPLFIRFRLCAEK
jgi:hypothetical protein